MQNGQQKEIKLHLFLMAWNQCPRTSNIQRWARHAWRHAGRRHLTLTMSRSPPLPLSL